VIDRVVIRYRGRLFQYPTIYTHTISTCSPRPPQGPHLGWYDQKMGLILGSSLNLRNNPKLNPVLGVGPAPRVNDWVQSGSGWPPGSEIYQITEGPRLTRFLGLGKNRVT
jgi:hypothetical protein